MLTLGGFRGNKEGATVIEFAIVAPVLFLLLIGIVEIGLVFFTNAVLEGATNIGARIGKTGYTTDGLSREDYIRSQITRLSGGFLDPALLTITILSYDNFNNIGQPEPCITATCGGGQANIDYVDVNHNGVWDSDQGATSAGGGGAVALYRVSYPWTFFTPLIGNIFGDNNNQYNITAIAAVRNEPF